MKRPFLLLSIACAIAAASCATCYTGFAPDRAGAGEAGAVVAFIITAFLTVIFYRKRNEPMT